MPRKCRSELAAPVRLCRPDAEARPGRYAVIYAGEADDLAAAGLPFRHPRAPCWIARAGSRWKVHICTYDPPGGLRSHREQIVRELAAVYRPRCNRERYEHAWEDEWIGHSR
ncbi:hypothetical protein [Amycolatopsis sp. cmx-8-4]|uniref:hypothetical protein n=1 Tax=Amycolatopsis sp. cmx-8-4 TaxID=2790947 RepID=UPI00397B67CD